VVQTRWLSVRNNWAAVIFLFRLAVVFLFNSSTYIKWRLLSSHLFPPAPLFFLSLLQCFIWIVSISWLIVLFLLLISLCIDGWLNQWINEWIEQWKNEPMNEWMNEWQSEWHSSVLEWNEWPPSAYFSCCINQVGRKYSLSVELFEKIKTVPVYNTVVSLNVSR